MAQKCGADFFSAALEPGSMGIFQGGAKLRADVASVERARNRWVARAFDDRAAIGENGELVGIYAEAEKKIIAADFAGGVGDRAVQGGEIEAASAFVDLHGIAAAERDVRLRIAVQVAEIVLHAGAAIGIAGDADGAMLIGPDVEGNEALVQRGALAD